MRPRCDVQFFLQEATDAEKVANAIQASTTLLFDLNIVQVRCSDFVVEMVLICVACQE